MRGRPYVSPMDHAPVVKHVGVGGVDDHRSVQVLDRSHVVPEACVHHSPVEQRGHTVWVWVTGREVETHKKERGMVKDPGGTMRHLEVYR